MALEAVVYPPQGSFPFAYYASNYIDSDFCFLDPNIHQWDTSSSSFSHHPNYNLDNNSNSSPDHQASSLVSSSHLLPAPGPRRKRRRTRTTKNRDEIENQRMTHIAVERNRRKQMNDYLAVLRSLMPSSYVQRGDQASIVGGSINFVKELEQLLQSMEAQKHNSNSGGAADSSSDSSSSSSSSPFSDFFTFPQYSTAARAVGIPNNINKHEDSSGFRGIENGGVADIEVTMVESHANIKILTKKRARQLLKVVAMFQNLSLSVLHLSLTTTLDQMVLYSLSVKAEEGCHLNTVDEIAAAVNQILTKIQEEAGAFS